jgi:hypothetical protein
VDLRSGDLVWFRQYDDMLGEGPGIDRLGILVGISEDRGISVARVIGERAGWTVRTGIASGTGIIEVPVEDVWAGE